MGVKHAFTSASSDGADATLVRPSDWNADHVVTGSLALPAGTTIGGRQNGWFLLTSGTVSAVATLDIVLTSYTGFRGIWFVLNQWQSVTNDVDLMLRTSSDGGSTYVSAASSYDWDANFDTADGSFGSFNTPDATSMVVADGNTNTSTRGTFVKIWMPSNLDTSFRTRVISTSCFESTSHTLNVQTNRIIAVRLAVGKCDAVRFLYESGNISSGLYSVYGLL